MWRSRVRLLAGSDEGKETKSLRGYPADAARYGTAEEAAEKSAYWCCSFSPW